MPRFKTRLVAGRKPPYTTWTFVIVPPQVAKTWGTGQKAVRGTLSGHAFRGTASRGEGTMRVAIPRAFREQAGLRKGEPVDVVLELDAQPRRVRIPAELAAVFKDDPAAAELYDRLPPSHRRAWAAYVAEARRPETRMRRARLAPEGIRARAFPR